MNKTLELWLRGNEPRIIIPTNKNCYDLIRVSLREGLDDIFYRKTHNSNTPEIGGKFEHGGIYNRYTGQLFNIPINFKWDKLCDETDGEYSTGKVIEAAEKRVREIVDASLDNNRDNLRIKSVDEIADKNLLDDLEYHREYTAAKDARRLFLDGELPEDITIQCDYEYDRKNGLNNEILDCIIDNEDFCHWKAVEYFDAEQEQLFVQFLENDATREEMQKIVDNPEHEAHFIKGIMDAMRKAGVTVMVTTDIDGKVLTFKTQASDLNRDPEGHYYTFNIAAQDRQIFMETYGKNAEYFPKDIVKITYGRAVIYERGQAL